jgi:hypothetical protein
MARPQRYRIALDGKWSFEDLQELPRAFNQLYAFAYVFVPNAQVQDDDALKQAFSSYPWQGGYRVLFHQIPVSLRPDVNSMRYGSPGWIDLQLLAEAAKQVGTIVGVVATNGIIINKLYHDIHKGASDRKLLRIKEERAAIRLTQSNLDFIMASSKKLAKAIEFKNLDELEAHTENKLATLKILMSFYRRVRTLVEFQDEGKAKFPD